MSKLAPLESHLEELRYRLIVSLVAVAAGVAAAWFRAPWLLHEVVRRLDSRLVFVQPGEAFSAVLNIAIVAGLALASPVVLYQLVAFVVPGLTPRERRLLYAALPAAAVLFFCGAAFAYVYLVPFAWRFLLGFATPDVQPFITVSAFLSFLLGLVVPVGLVFEWPLVVLALARLGLVSPRALRSGRRLAYLLILIVAGAVTPPDVTSQMLVSLPLFVLYEAGILLSRWAYRER
ncbi:MAG: twin-arginine translocase subunit TatC [Firmicutes bacterium]|nr:twin-arginine translocase subunit TatC [Bacillota bacterium]